MTMLLSLMLLGCSDKSTDTADTAGAGDDTSGAQAAPAPELGFDCSTGFTVEQDEQQWTVGGHSRSFHADLPSVDADTPVGVIFSWHGIGDSINGFRSFFAPDPDGYDFPFVVFTMHDTGMWPWDSEPGLYWDMFASEAGDDNREAALIEEILGCYSAQQAIDTTRLYTVGFSGGAIVSNMVHSRYPDLFGAGIALSGAWFNDAETVAGVNTVVFSIDIAWDALDASHGGTILQTHGGNSDSYSLQGVDILDFETSNQLALEYLPANGRTVIDCPHSFGHYPHPQLSVDDMVGFFEDHPYGVESPYRTEMAAALADDCTAY